MSVKDCTYPGCGDPRFARKLCRRHYERRRKGAPMAPPKYASRLTAEQLTAIITGKDSLRETARKYGVSPTYVAMLRRGERKPVGR